MNNETYGKTLRAAYIAVEIINELPVEEALAAAERSDSLAPLINSAIWHEKHEALEQDIEVLKKLVELKQLVSPNPTSHIDREDW